MRAVLTALTDELKRLKATGVRTVSVSEENLAALRRVVQRRPKGPGARPEVAAMPVAPHSPPPTISAKETPRPSPPVSSLPPPPAVALAAGDKRTRWTALRARVLGDGVCRAHVRPGKQVVFGVGDPEAKIFFC